MTFPKKPKSNSSRVNLQRDRFSTPYLERLALGFSYLSRWFCSLKPMPVLQWNRQGINALLIRFVQDMFDAKVPLYIVTHALLAFEEAL